MNIFENCPTLENEKFILRPVVKEDCEELRAVYGDKKALPFFNSDNCHGDNFYYATTERMLEAMKFWDYSYENGWFVRMSIVDKAISKVVGTVELCVRESDRKGILRVDVRSDYETQDKLVPIFALIAPKMPELIGCNDVLTKAPIYAVERIEAITQVGFKKFEQLIAGNDGKMVYDGYWVLK